MRVFIPPLEIRRHSQTRNTFCWSGVILQWEFRPFPGNESFLRKIKFVGQREMQGWWTNQKGSQSSPKFEDFKGVVCFDDSLHFMRGKNSTKLQSHIWRDWGWTKYLSTSRKVSPLRKFCETRRSKDLWSVLLLILISFLTNLKSGRSSYTFAIKLNKIR